MDYGSPANRLETNRTLRLLRRHRPQGRLLELGPGSGALLSAAREQGYDVAAVELNPVQVRFIREELDVPCAESLDAVDGLFDVIYHRDVLSHFSDPVQVFEQIHRRLKPGGLHIFETGNGDFAPRYERLFASFQFPDHLFFFSQQSISLLLQRTGFVHVETDRYALTPVLLGQRLLAAVRRSAEPPQAAVAEIRPAGRRGLSRAAYAAIGRTRYALRYGAGAIAPKERRPFTMIVVAARHP
jgi:SAM-dependent methyltransferase